MPPSKKRPLQATWFPYEVNAPFWSDNAKKARYFVLPDGKQLEYSEKGNWRVPIGSTIIKHFKLQVGRKIKFVETRLIKRTKDGWEAATYVWDNQEKEAELMTGGKQFEYWNQSGVQSWHAPSASECASCHVDASGYVLGMTTAQLNRDVDGTNQISNWVKKGLVSLPKEIDLNNADRYCSPFDKDADLETRARVYLDVNCAMCHQPNGTGNAIIDLRYTSSLEGLKSIGVKPGQGDLGNHRRHVNRPRRSRTLAHGSSNANQKHRSDAQYRQQCRRSKRYGSNYRMDSQPAVSLLRWVDETASTRVVMCRLAIN